MSELRNERLQIATAVAAGVFCAFLTTLALIVAIYELFPDGGLHVFVRLILGDRTATSTLSSSPIYLSAISQIAWLEMFVVSPIAMFICGLTIGRRIGAWSRAGRVYAWAGGTTLFLNLALIGLVWAGKRVSEGGHIQASDLTPRIEINQLLGLVLWVGVAVIGSDLGRRLANRSARIARPA